MGVGWSAATSTDCPSGQSGRGAEERPAGASMTDTDRQTQPIETDWMELKSTGFYWRYLDLLVVSGGKVVMNSLRKWNDALAVRLAVRLIMYWLLTVRRSSELMIQLYWLFCCVDLLIWVTGFLHHTVTVTVTWSLIGLLVSLLLSISLVVGGWLVRSSWVEVKRSWLR